MKSTQKAANRLAALGAAKKQSIAKKARATIALIVAKKDEIARDFYTIGRALVALDDKAVIAALGYKSFAALCDVELRMSAAQAARLMNVVKSFSERDAEQLTAAKATAIIDLAGAMGGKTTPRGADSASRHTCMTRAPSAKRFRRSVNQNREQELQ